MRTLMRSDFVWLPGTIPVAYLLFGTRWISHVGVPPVYVTDVLVCLSIGWGFIRLHFLGRLQSPFSDISKGGFGFIALIFLFAWASLRFLAGPVFDVNSARDFAPLLYALLGILVFFAQQKATPAGLINTGRILFGALLAHEIVCFVQTFVLRDFNAGSDFDTNVQIFTLRIDVDTALVGLFAAICIVLFVIRETLNWLYLLGFILSWVTIAPLDSRAGFIGATVVALTAIFAFALRARQRPLKSRLRLLIAVMCVIIAPIAVVGTSSISQKFADTPVQVESGIANQSVYSPAPNSSGGADTAPTAATGTVGARINSWYSLEKWILSDPERFIVGVGFGAHYMKDSGAGEKLLGAGDPRVESVRSPHNFLLGLGARLGIIGLVLMLLTLFGYGVVAIRIIFNAENALLTMLAILIPLSIVLVSLAGVVFESPFGAIPFWWALGVVFSLAKRRKIEIGINADES